MAPTTCPPVTAVKGIVAFIDFIVVFVIVVFDELPISIVGINCWVVVKALAGNTPFNTWYCKTPMSVFGSIAATLLAGAARNFEKASFDGATSVKLLVDERVFRSAGWPASNALRISA
jgi:hypothetical protein